MNEKYETREKEFYLTLKITQKTERNKRDFKLID